MRNYMNRAWLALGTCIVVGMLSGPSCAAGEAEDVGELRQPLLCASVDVCDDNDPCTDDLCVLSLCVNVPLLNCCQGCTGGAGGEGAGGNAGSSGNAGSGGSGGNDGGQSGSAGSSDGGTAGERPSGTSGSTNEGGSGGEGDAGSSAGGTGAATSGEGGAAAAGTVSEAGASAAVGESGDGDGTSNGSAWRLEGGGCALSPRASGSESQTWLLAIATALLLGRGAARRRGRRGKGTFTS